MFWSTRSICWFQLMGMEGESIQPTGPLLGDGTQVFRRSAAWLATGTMPLPSSVKSFPVAGSLGTTQPVIWALKLALKPVLLSHSLKSPFRMRAVGACPVSVVPVRRRFHSDDQKMNVLD